MPHAPPQMQRAIDEDDEARRKAVADRRQRRSDAGGRRQHVRAEPARQRRDPAIADDAHDAIAREQDADEKRVEPEGRRIQRQHDVDHAVAEPGDAQAGAGDDGVAIALLGCGRFRLVVLFLCRHPAPFRSWTRSFGAHSGSRVSFSVRSNHPTPSADGKRPAPSSTALEHFALARKTAAAVLGTTLTPRPDSSALRG